MGICLAVLHNLEWLEQEEEEKEKEEKILAVLAVFGMRFALTNPILVFF